MRAMTELEVLVKSPAGGIDFNPTTDSFDVDLYSNGVQNIFDQTNNLRNDFETIADGYCQKKQTFNDYLNFTATYNDLVDRISLFLKSSVWKLDDFVQLRKNIAVNALHEARRFKAEVDKQMNLPQPNFNVCREFGLQLYIDVDELYDHFFEILRYAPAERRVSLISIALKDN